MAVRKPSMQLKAFGAEVRRLREEAGVKPADLAKLVSVSRSYISQVELGRTRCRKALLNGSTRPWAPARN